MPSRSAAFAAAGMAVLAAYASSAVAQTVTLNPALSSSQAASLSPVISPSYAGLGIEPSNLLAFTGTTSVNQLTFQLLSNLANYTGVPPHLRVGGNSGDNMLYSASETSYFLQPNPSSSGAGNSAKTDGFLFGPNYFRALDRLPKGTPVTYGLNLAYTGSDYADRIVAQAQAAFDNLDNVTLVGLEIGNEPDLYTSAGYRPSSYTVQQFGQEWGDRARILYNRVLAPRNLPTNFFEPATTATTATKNGQPFRISNLVNTGVAADNGVYVAGWNQHDYFYYVGVSSFELTTDYLLDLSHTVSQFNEWTNQAGQALVTGKPYYLREMGSVGPEGIKGISDTFANTLWTFNFFFFAATQQISSVQMHATDASYGSPWQPRTINGVSPRVRSSYYAWAAFDQVVGASCNTRVAPISIGGTPSSYNNRLGAYASYRGGTLTSLVMINTQTLYTGATAGTMTFSFKLPSLAGQTVYLSTLNATGSDATTNTTWNGISYEVSGNGQPTVVDGSTVVVTIAGDGSLSVPVRDSSAVVANIGFKLGNERVNATSCNVLAATAPEGGENTASGTTAAAPAPTFKSTSGFQNTGGGLSTGAIAGIAAGGGAAVLIFLALVIFFCVRMCRKKRDRKSRYYTTPPSMAPPPPPPPMAPFNSRPDRSRSHEYAPVRGGTPQSSGYSSPYMGSGGLPPPRFSAGYPPMTETSSRSSSRKGRPY
ncbi:uncharacterized protein PFL1_00500 [Pseudozyma flocculosa PF-1]|uniref:Beta-glucuronidase C-terminal domain-containing protein n=1 Tax=Pseudozyma flocculosa TaxID=84751 RepID=A0A5C3EUH9_9BASI|nr:uncharacterized protein PFL1_00500 [Pseudozyma flocculosa PF-1]EPQ32304.1 hypothetical protein PFL1_00500 [Pseudozyma flocculosa PF-1]SPO34739.1 uncharacterized protein PSFLO_00210 [Pseudozyma flocculosa]